MGKGFNFVSYEEQQKWLGKEIRFEQDGYTFYGKINLFTKDGVEIKWDGPCPSDWKVGGVAVYKNVKGTLDQLIVI